MMFLLQLLLAVAIVEAPELAGSALGFEIFLTAFFFDGKQVLSKYQDCMTDCM